ncbi:25266_t:CDS:2, partial [Racocetra persica]
SLTDDELYDFQQILELYSYSYGTPIFPDDHYLKEIYYYCGNSDNLVSPSESLKECFKQIYPLCEICQENGRSFYTRAEIKTNNRAQNILKNNFYSLSNSKSIAK